MFPSRYFTRKYWAKRFWSDSGALPVGVPLVLTAKSKSQIFLLPNFSSAPDCFVAFQGVIDLSSGFEGVLNTSATGVLGMIYPEARFQGIIDDSNTGFNGTLTDKEGFESEVTGEKGFNGDICNC